MADIKERIKKLLALATSPYEAEAMAAMLKAKELMAKHKLTEADFVEFKNQKMVHLACKDIRWTTDSGEIWIAELCRIVAGNYCCVIAWSTPYKTRTHELEITGMEEDAEVCKHVIEYAVGFVRGAIKVAQRRQRLIDPKTVAASYAKGFIEGLKMAFEDQQEEHPEWALVVVEPQEVKEYGDSLNNKTIRTRKTGFDPLSHMKGFNDGKEFNAQRVLQ